MRDQQAQTTEPIEATSDQAPHEGEAYDEADLDTILNEIIGIRQSKADETEEQAADRLATDIEQLAELQAAGFTGPKYEAFRDELWAYGIRVMHAFMLHPGKIQKLCQAKGVPVVLSGHAAQALHTSWDTRTDLAVDTIASAEEYFREKVLKPDKWRPGPGAASLKSYFIGACAFGFQRALRRWEADHRQDTVADDVVQALDPFTRSPDPADRAVVMDQLRRILTGAKPPTLAICALILQDLTHKQIGEKLGISAKAVERHVARLRHRARYLADGASDRRAARRTRQHRDGEAA